jgi:MFS family permease
MGSLTAKPSDSGHARSTWDFISNEGKPLVNYFIIQIIYALQFLRFGIVFPLVPLIAERLGAGPSMIGIVVGMFSLFSIFLAIPMGSLVDRFGVKRIVAVGVCCNIASAVVLLVADTLTELILAQVTLGLAFLLHVVGCQAYISNLQTRSSLEKGFGQLTLGAAIGQSLGPVAGGLLVVHSGYRAAFTTSLVISLLGLAVLRLKEDQLDAGNITRRSITPELRQVVRLIAEPSILYVLIFSFAVMFAVNLRSSFLPVFLRTQSMSEAGIGLIIGFLALTATLVRFFFAWLCAIFDRKPIILLSAAVVGLGTLIIPVLPSIAGAGFAVLLIGLGFGVAQPLSMLMLSELRPPGTAGLTMGLRFTVIILATFVSPVVSGQIVKLLGIEYAFYAATLIVLTAGILIIFRFK